MEEIKVMQFERSDVLRQRRLKNQLTVKEFRRVVVPQNYDRRCDGNTYNARVFSWRNYSSINFTIRKSTHMSRQAPRCPNKINQLNCKTEERESQWKKRNMNCH